MRLTALSLFSGCLGLDLGMELAGIKSLAYVDKDPCCRETIRQNRPRSTIFDDVFSKDVTTFARQNRVDVVVGGPPCQSFSTIGKRLLLDDERGKAILGFVEVIEKVKPAFFVMENVKGIVSAGSIDVMTQIRNRFTKAGYNTSWTVLDAAEFGVPQYRQRFFMVGRKGKGAILLPKPIKAIPRTLRDAIGDLENNQHEGIEFSPSIRSVMATIPEGGNWKSLPKEKQDKAMGAADRTSGGLTAFYRRLSYDRPSPTLLTCPAQRATTLCHPTKTRPLSIAEYKRIQCFPDDWVVAGNTRDQYRQLGNAVPVLLGKAIGIAVIKMAIGGSTL